MKSIAAILFLILSFQAFSAEEITKTPTGIALDTSWKQDVYQFAVKNVRHASWGLTHSERNYQIAKKLAEKENIVIDLDVLFVSAYLHDLGGIAPFEVVGVDHAVRSVELVEPMLKEWGFPMEKWEQVKEMILAHTYYTSTTSSKQALAFRDADVLDFLGSIGVARILAITTEPGTNEYSLQPTVGILKDFSKSMAGKCSLNACREFAKSRQAELVQFLNSLNAASFNGEAL